MNKKTAFSKTYTQKSINSNTDGCEDDEGLALLIPDIQVSIHIRFFKSLLMKGDFNF